MASAVAFMVSLAFSTRFWPGFIVAGIGFAFVLAFPVMEAMTTLPSDTLQRSFSDPTWVEVYAMIICLEALLAASALWYSTSRRAYLRNVVLLLPMPVTVAALFALAQASMVHGPRINLELLGWAGLCGGLVLAMAVTGVTCFIKVRAPDFVLELSLFLRLLAMLFAAGMISLQMHRPTPVIEFQSEGFLIFLIVCLVFTSYGYFRRPHY